MSQGPRLLETLTNTATTSEQKRVRSGKENCLYAKEILKQTSYYSLIGGYKDIFKNPTTKKYKDGPMITVG